MGRVVSDAGRVVSAADIVVSDASFVVSGADLAVSNIGFVVSAVGLVVSEEGRVVSAADLVVSDVRFVVSSCACKMNIEKTKAIKNKEVLTKNRCMGLYSNSLEMCTVNVCLVFIGRKLDLSAN